jgi:hypothetical protein
MTPKIFAALLCVAVVCLHGAGQAPNADPEKALKDSLVGQSLVLANFSGANKITGTWDGQTPSLEAPPWHALAAVHIEKAQLRGQEVTIKGSRRQLTRDNSGGLVYGKYETPVTLTINLSGDPKLLAPTLRDAFFFHDTAAAFDRMPKDLQDYLSPVPLTDRAAGPESSCGCPNPLVSCHQMGNGAGDFKGPPVISSVKPQFSEEAQQKKISANVMVGVRLGADGQIRDEWILKDAGYGLDPQAALAVRQYKFASATCHDKPVPVALQVLVNFKIY